MTRRLLVLAALLALVALAILAAATVRPYGGHDTLNAGLAWDWGGIETRGVPGVFLCSASYHPADGTRWLNPLARLFPSLVVDC